MTIPVFLRYQLVYRDQNQLNNMIDRCYVLAKYLFEQC